jgi:branched-subunit amino acid ABC-type transport system permease component
VFDFEILLQQILNGLVLGSVCAWSRWARRGPRRPPLINFAHGDVLMVGAMVGATV